MCLSVCQSCCKTLASRTFLVFIKLSFLLLFLRLFPLFFIPTKMDLDYLLHLFIVLGALLFLFYKLYEWYHKGQPKLVNRKLVSQYRGTRILTEFKLNQLKLDFHRNAPAYLKAKFWIHVPMPQNGGFTYTGIVLSNDIVQGLLHSFVRHWDQWVKMIPGMKSILDRLQPIRGQLDKVKSASYESSKKVEIPELDRVLKRLDSTEIQSTLFQAQLQILTFLRDNTKKFLNLKSNRIGQNQLHFEVKDRFGKKWVMVLAVSDTAYLPVDGFGDKRPVRLIITVYFE